MIPQRLSIKFFATGSSADDLDLEPFIGIFHHYIQDARLEGLLIDVADYAHVPDGPGVMLIGHDVDYGIDLNDGRLGLLTTRKRYADIGLEDLLRDTLRKALIAVEALDESDAKLSLDTAAVEIRFLDRLLFPNDGGAAATETAEAAVTAVFGQLGVGAQLSRSTADDAEQ